MFYLLGHRFMTKGDRRGAARRKRCGGHGTEEGRPRPLRLPPPLISACSPAGSSLAPVLSGGYGGFSTRAALIKSLAIAH